MSEDAKGTAKGMDRRKFLMIAGAAAALGGFLIATKGKGVGSLLKTQTAQPQQIQGRYVKTAAPATQATPLTSFLSKILGGKL